MTTLRPCLVLVCAALFISTSPTAASEPYPPNKSIPLGQLGATVSQQYSGNGLSIIPTANGALIKAAFQDLEAEATSEGLWLISCTESDTARATRFRLRASAIGRLVPSLSPSVLCNPLCEILPTQGSVRIDNDYVLWNRPGLVEEYRTGMDGIRQDFLVLQRPAREGDLILDLDLSGANAHPATYGATLILDGNGRAIAYSRLHVTDAAGRELPASISVTSPDRLRIVVADDDATYPVRIDPTFTDDNWISMGDSLPGTDGTVYAVAMDDSGNIYIGGSFSIVGSGYFKNIAQWNGTAWSPLGNGTNNTVYALALSGNQLYAGGAFTSAGNLTANRIASWNGTAWSPLGTGMNHEVRALALSGNTVYVGGSFTSAGILTVNRIASWNGTAWSPLGSGTNGTIYALAASDSDLYIGGAFTSAGGNPANYVAQWNGTAWNPLGAGMGGSYPTVFSLALSGNTLFAGGQFTAAGGIGAFYIAQWNGTAWSALGNGIEDSYSSSYRVNALAVSGTNLYAGGYFFGTDAQSLQSIARWDGNSWSTLGNGTGTSVHALATSGNRLIAGGSFSAATANGSNALDIASWDGSAWHALAGPVSGPTGPVLAMTIMDSDLYIGGTFLGAGGVAVNNIACWNGNSWNSLDNGTDGAVYALASMGSILFAGGNFSSAGDVPANNIAQWNGTDWNAMDNGTDDTVYALATDGNDLYVGGSFVYCGDVFSIRVAKWNGSAWLPLGSGLSSSSRIVYALAVSGNIVYAGGTSSTVASRRLNKWDGSTWRPVGSIGESGSPSSTEAVYALAVIGSDLYVGGKFSHAFRTYNVNNIVKWNGTTGSRLGNGTIGTSGTVYAMTTSGSNLFIAGSFPHAGGVTVNSIAQWNGTAWSALGSGAYGTVNSLATLPYSNILYAGGSFTQAGGNISPFLTRADFRPPEPSLLVLNGSPITQNETVDCIGAPTGFAFNRTLTLINIGNQSLTGISIGKDGANPGDFSFSSPPASLHPGRQTQLNLTFTPSSTGNRSATLLIASNDPDDNPFLIQLTGRGLSDQEDTDGDGLNDVAEFHLSAQGFDWRTAQTGLVATLLGHAPDAGYYPEADVRNIYAGPPSISIANGTVTLDLQLLQSDDMENWSPFGDPIQWTDPLSSRAFYQLFFNGSQSP